MKQMGMDRKIEKKQWTPKKVYSIIGVVVFVVIAFFGFKSFNKKEYNLDASKIQIKKVIEDDFQDVILINGDIESVNLVLVNTLEGGSVEEIFIEDGIYVKKGTPLVRLSNPAVTLNYMNQETAIVEQINNLRNLKLTLEKDQRNLAESLIDSENSLAEVERDYKVDSVLYAKDIIAKNDFIDRQESYKYLENKRDFMDRNVKKSSADNKIQIEQINKSINMMQRNLNMIHQNIEKMLVKAPVDGMLSSFDPVIGESYDRNQTVAKIDVQSGFKIKGQVNEYYLSSVKPGQLARFSFNGETLELKVKKVLPEVINRNFEIELVFVNEVPKAITIGQNIQVRLELSKAQKSVLIPRGNFFQSSGGQFVYVLDGEGRAHKRIIKLGSQNPSYYQVLEGLNPGEEIVTSSYDAFKNYETIRIN
ncbi:efflux RND transporter periplasmic adaptor subunit [Urechidicola vernalis]|uniref:HlyD family efflux transporter periplasmic adaptor subunit n=1 Tax=Urechidicola vernalis TaxID=3075600 RepID=A0ABU2Y9Z9_9FLAO|nr:HlyD family efflux transporter periplasmic adaptor subunit [Urechidicola sp. P050]MDT0554080.1 HlyD family efflux transporter periplasmic adaptor subunit [Urechidicola sp. P050]